jgi:hypothetical protein
MNRNNIQMKMKESIGTITKIERKVGNKIMRYARMKVNGIITTIYVGCDVIAPHLTK